MSAGQNASPTVERNVGGNPSERPCLVVILRPELTLAKNLRWPLKGFTAESRVYRDAGFGDWTEFYDWLRDSHGNLLGVRYWLRADTEFLASYAKGMSYVQADPPRHIEIYFSERREFNPQRSCDQEFLYDAIFSSDNGEHAIAFGMEGLSKSDLDALESMAAVRWTSARLLE